MTHSVLTAAALSPLETGTPVQQNALKQKCHRILCSIHNTFRQATRQPVQKACATAADIPSTYDLLVYVIQLLYSQVYGLHNNKALHRDAMIRPFESNSPAVKNARPHKLAEQAKRQRTWDLPEAFC